MLWGQKIIFFYFELFIVRPIACPVHSTARSGSTIRPHLPPAPSQENNPTDMHTHTHTHTHTPAYAVVIFLLRGLPERSIPG
jgi:hypothetical protein